MLGLIAGLAAAAGAPASTGAVYHRLVPMGNSRAWFLPEDYPPTAIAARAEANVRFALQVGTDGRPTACRILKSGGNAALDEATCKALMARAQFHPMVDRKGRPTTSTYENAVRWHLPAKGAVEASDGGFDAHAIVGTTGDVIECAMNGAGSGRFGGTNGNSCGPFGERGFLSTAMGEAYAKARSVHVRLSLSYPGRAKPVPARTPDFTQSLAEAQIAIGADGTMGSCTSVRPLQMQGRSVDLCNIVAMSPPRLPAAKGKTAIYALDLSADFR